MHRPAAPPVPVPGGGRTEADERKRASNNARALDVGLVDGSDAFALANILGDEATPRERELAGALWGGAMRRVGTANLGAKDARTATALTKFERLAQILPSLNGLRKLRYEGDLDTSDANEAILLVVSEYVRELPKNKVGELVKGDTVSGQTSAIKTLAEEHFGRAVICESGGRLLKRSLQSMRREDGPGGERRYSAPMRRGMLDELARLDSGFDVRSAGWPQDRWAMMQASHQAFMRGGEPGCTEAGKFAAAKGICWKHICWRCPLTGGLATSVHETTGAAHLRVTLGIVPIKDQTGKAKRVPCPIVSKHPAGHPLDDVTCPYTAIRASWDARIGSRPWSELQHLPFFVGPDGLSAVTTEQVRDAAIRPAAECLGYVAASFGSSALRRGGATDAKANLGAERAKALIQARGRWLDKDIGDIYARGSLEDQAALSAALLGGRSFTTMEEAYPGWVQPTRWARR